MYRGSHVVRIGAGNSVAVQKSVEHSRLETDGTPLKKWLLLFLRRENLQIFRLRFFQCGRCDGIFRPRHEGILGQDSLSREKAEGSGSWQTSETIFQS